MTSLVKSAVDSTLAAQASEADSLNEIILPEQMIAYNAEVCLQWLERNGQYFPKEAVGHIKTTTKENPMGGNTKREHLV